MSRDNDAGGRVWTEVEVGGRRFRYRRLPDNDRHPFAGTVQYRCQTGYWSHMQEHSGDSFIMGMEAMRHRVLERLGEMEASAEAQEGIAKRANDAKAAYYSDGMRHVIGHLRRLIPPPDSESSPQEKTPDRTQPAEG